MKTVNEISNFVRPEMTKFKGYSACKSPDVIAQKLGIPVENIIKLDANENNYGPSPKVSVALGKFDHCHIYPDAAQTELRQLLAEYTCMPPEQIVAGAGSDQIIDLLVKLFAGPKDEIINMGPSFAMYRFYADLNGATIVEVPRDAEFKIDIPAIKKAINDKTRLIFLANPNNPTGTMTSQDEIRILAATGVPLVVDEAYYEFTGESALPLMSEFANIMVLRTFSKWCGLAGLRVGYGIFPLCIANYLNGIRDPYNVNMAALEAVRVSFQDMDYLMGNVKKIVEAREKLFAQFSKINWLKPYPSKSNFILCDVLKGNARELQQMLEDKGILVRYYADARLKNCIRFSVGRPEENDSLLAALKEIGG